MKNNDVKRVLKFLEKNTQLSNVEHYRNEDKNNVFVSDECFIVIDRDMRIHVDFNVDLYPDSAANITLSIIDLTRELSGDIVINDVFAYDDNGEIHFGEDAREVDADETASFINQQVEDVLQMDQILLSSRGHEC